jgi:NRPS condensation-like uncharacterized protein
VTRSPFTRLEEAVYYVERAYTPWNMQVELTTAASLERGRLREAVRATCRAHPIAAARCRRDDDGPTAYAWVAGDPDDVPIETATAEDADDLNDLRERFYGDFIDLTTEPPLRLLVVRGAEADRLCVSMSHVPMDGIGGFLLLQTLCEAYGGDAPDASTLADRPAPDLLADARPDSFRRKARLLAESAHHLRKLAAPPADIAPEGAGTNHASRFVHRRLDAETTRRLLEVGPDGASVNDVLLAALHRTIGDWNADHGRRADRISLMMPVSVRPDDRFYEGVALCTLFDSIATDPEDRRRFETTLERVTEQTRRIKRTERPLGFLEWLDIGWRILPPAARKRLPLLLRGPGDRLLDTAVLSNLGRLPSTPGFSGEGPEELWCTPPCWPPTPLSIGVVTIDGSMRLGFRAQSTTLDREGTAAFADRYCRSLEELV